MIRARRSPQAAAFLSACALTACALTACGSSGDGEPSPPPPATSSASSPSPSPSSTAPPTGSQPSGLPDPRKIDQRDATAVSRAAIQVMWTVDAATDRSQRDAYLRARPYLTAEYVTALTAQAATGAIPAPWADHRAYGKVRLTPRTPEGDIEPDTPTAAYRGWAITVTPTGRDGWQGTPVHAIAFVALKRPNASSPWRISHVGTN